jgi:hypothetical protein
MSKEIKIIGWYEYTTIEENVGINNEQYHVVTNYAPIFEGETEEDAKRRNRNEHL